MAVKVINNSSKVFGDISKKKAPMFINAVLDIIDQNATFHAPIAYSNLVNSKFRNLINHDNKVSGTLGFIANYAVHLNGDGTYKPVWKPKPPPKYGNAKRGIAPAPSWNPQAKPGFLTEALDSPEAQADLRKAINIFRV